MFKAMCFFGFVMLFISIASSFMSGSSPTVGTKLTVALSAVGTTVTVKSTTGFDSVGTIAIGDERIHYANKTATTFVGRPAQALERGYGTSEAVAHGAGSAVRTTEGALINEVFDVKMANIADSAGIMKFLAIGDMAFSMIATFFTVPLTFLGTGLAFISYFWMLMGACFLVFLGLTLTGGRRV